VTQHKLGIARIQRRVKHPLHAGEIKAAIFGEWMKSMNHKSRCGQARNQAHCIASSILF